MKVDADAVAGIRLKVTRAFDHLASLQASMDQFMRNDPYGLVPEVQSQGTKHFRRLKLREPIPTIWSVVLGEAVHDLRSALDHVVYTLTIDRQGRALESTAFPIVAKSEHFFQTAKITPRNASGFAFTSGAYKIRGVGPGPKAFIESSQPYAKRRVSAYRSLRDLEWLWNHDKHRLVHLWGLRFHDPNFSMQPGFEDCIVFPVANRILHDRAVAIKIVSPTPRPHVQVSGHMTADVAIKMPRRQRRGDYGSLWLMYAECANVVSQLLGALGNQDAPISLSAFDETIPIIDTSAVYWPDPPGPPPGYIIRP